MDVILAIDASSSMAQRTTDGRSRRDVAVAAAQHAKDAGVVVFTIGVGADVDTEALRAMASRADYFFPALGVGDLHGIYEAIAVNIPCKPTRFWGRS